MGKAHVRHYDSRCEETVTAAAVAFADRRNVFAPRRLWVNKLHPNVITRKDVICRDFDYLSARIRRKSR